MEDRIPVLTDVAPSLPTQGKKARVFIICASCVTIAVFFAILSSFIALAVIGEAFGSGERSEKLVRLIEYFLIEGAPCVLYVISAVFTILSAAFGNHKKKLFGAGLLTCAVNLLWSQIGTLITFAKAELLWSSVFYFALASVLIAAAVIYFRNRDGCIPALICIAVLTALTVYGFSIFLSVKTVDTFSLYDHIARFIGKMSLYAAFTASALTLRNKAPKQNETGL